jgi:hypothetical protein
MRCVLAAVAFSLFAVPATAQTVERTIDLSALGWGKLTKPLPVDTDGNPATREWVVQSADFDNGRLGHWRVITERAEGLCVGDWFDPRRTPSSSAHLVTEDGRDKLIVSHGSILSFGTDGRYDIVRLDTPRCR